MAETKIVSIDAIQNIQQLKDNIKELKAEVNTLTVGSEEYNRKVLQLAENQRALKLAQTGVYDSMKDVASASKLDTDAINETVSAAKKGTATYNEMSAALGQLKNEIKSIPKYLSEEAQAIGEVNPAYQSLNDKIQTLDSTLKQLDADNGVFGRNVGNYLGALQEWGGAMGQVNQIGNQLMTGVIALLGVMNMFGADTEDTKDSLQSLVPVLAILNAGKGIGGLVKLLPKAASSTATLATATAANAAANTANATAAGAATVATEAQTVAQEGLNKSMLANPVLAVIAGLTALIGVVAKYVSNANKAAKATRDLAKEQEELNTKFTQQNEELDREQKILEAQGTSQRELLVKKRALLKAQKAETEAILLNVKARLIQMKSDSAWVRFWKGENKQIKNLEEQMKSLNEQIKGFDKQIANIDIDIQVDAINKGKDAASKAAKETSDLIKEALSISNEAIKANRTELENLTSTYEEQSKTLNDAFEVLSAKLNKMKKGTKEYNELLKIAQTIFNGMLIIEDKYQTQSDEITKDNSREAYIKKITGIYNNLFYGLNSATKDEQKYEHLIDTVLGFSDSLKTWYTLEDENGEVTLKASKSTTILKQSYEELKMVIENDIRALANFNGELEDLRINDLSWDAMLNLSQTDADRLAKTVGEPLATAIGEWFKNENSLNEASYKWLTEAVTGGKILIGDLLEGKNYGGAKLIANKIVNMLYQAFPSSNEDVQNAITLFGIELNKSINEAIGDNEYSTHFGERFSALTESTHSEFKAILKITDDFNKTFVASTADALSAVANLWETSIKLKYKKLVESGKMTEEEAERQAEAEFENVKALQIGVAAINTAAAVVSALADPSVPSYYIRLANAIAAGVAGAAEIMTISMTEFGKPSVKTNSNVSTPSYTSEPNQTVYTYGINPADYAEASAQNPIRAYVVDSDLSQGLEQYNKRNDETTF